MPALVRGVERRRDLAHDRHRAGRRHRAVVLQDLAQVGAVDHAHVDVHHAVDLAVVVDRYDMGFQQPARRMRLPLQPLAEHRIVGDRLRQQFQRHDAVLLGVLGFVDLAHAAACRSGAAADSDRNRYPPVSPLGALLIVLLGVSPANTLNAGSATAPQPGYAPGGCDLEDELVVADPDAVAVGEGDAAADSFVRPPRRRWPTAGR